MSKYQTDVLEYIVCCVGAFAERFSLTNGQAYRYLQKHQGLAYLQKHYNTVHTFSIEDAVEDCAHICLRNGGALIL
ncbi:MAG: DUF3791 domain-containing protein [Bacteroidales bacterium]|nr:DUF3791 domain-containing protein [Candidatus Minthousia equi]MDO4955605.1 DUF3791 domain-containing protein [Bacteroidales bacterium]